MTPKCVQQYTTPSKHTSKAAGSHHRALVPRPLLLLTDTGSPLDSCGPAIWAMLTYPLVWLGTGRPDPQPMQPQPPRQIHTPPLHGSTNPRNPLAPASTAPAIVMCCHEKRCIACLGRWLLESRLLGEAWGTPQALLPLDGCGPNFTTFSTPVTAAPTSLAERMEAKQTALCGCCCLETMWGNRIDAVWQPCYARHQRTASRPSP